MTETPLIDVSTLWDCPFMCCTTREMTRSKPGTKNLGFQKKPCVAGEDFPYPVEDIKTRETEGGRYISLDWNVLNIEEMEEWFWESYISTNMWITDPQTIKRFNHYNEEHGLTFKIEGNRIMFYMTKEIFWNLISDNIIFEAKTRNLMVGFMLFLSSHPRITYFDGEFISQSKLKWKDLGKYFFRDHSTIIQQQKAHEDMMKGDKFYRECFDKLMAYAELLMNKRWVCNSKTEKKKG
jgi:hypothetical protein